MAHVSVAFCVKISLAAWACEIFPPVDDFMVQPKNRGSLDPRTRHFMDQGPTV